MCTTVRPGKYHTRDTQGYTGIHGDTRGYMGITGIHGVMCKVVKPGEYDTEGYVYREICTAVKPGKTYGDICITVRSAKYERTGGYDLLG